MTLIDIIIPALAPRLSRAWPWSRITRCHQTSGAMPMTDTTELYALCQAISDAETRAGREITEDEALAVARIFYGSQPRAWTEAPTALVVGGSHLSIARAAYAAGRASMDAKGASMYAIVAELEAALAHAETVFLRYAELHAAKGTEDGRAKADANLKEAYRTRAALKGGEA
jgi:hypothetical protein